MKHKPKLEIISDYNHTTDWFYEGNVSRCLVNYLKQNGYRILKDNSDNCRARGEDIIAVHESGLKEIIEVKGYPTEYQTKGQSKGYPKNTKPTLQAKHWFAEAIISTLLNFDKHATEPTLALAIAFPMFDRYTNLTAKIKTYFSANNLPIKVYFIDKTGKVTIDNLNSHYKL